MKLKEILTEARRGRKVKAVARSDDAPNTRNFVAKHAKNMPGAGSHRDKGGKHASRTRQKREWKKTAMHESRYSQRRKSGSGQDTYSTSLEDPNTGQEVPVVFRRSVMWDDGNVGFGTGYGKSPYPQGFGEVDEVVLDEPVMFMGREFPAGTDVSEFEQFMVPADKKDIWDIDKGDDGGYDPMDHIDPDDDYRY